jgi:GT2 family glycosyltransferase
VAVIDQAAGACLVLRRTTVERIGGLFDERFPIFFNDVDLSRRVRDAGLEVHVLYDLKARHVGGASVRQMPDAARRLELLRGLEAYYDRHEPPWKRRLVRSLIAGEVRRAAALDPSTPSAAPPPPGSA